jgi:hypothetical protein
VKTGAIVELAVAALAAVGCVMSWLAASTTVAATPVLPSEPPQPTVVYSSGWIVLAFFLAMIAGVLLVVGVAQLRRR